MSTVQKPPATLIKLLMAMLYDSLLLAAILMIAAAIPTLALSDVENLGENPLFRLYLLGIIILFPVGFWMKNGQTLGMLAWRLKLERSDGQPLKWGDTLKRLLVSWISIACVGLGYLWMLVNNEKKSWHDLASGTQIRQLPKRGKDEPII